MRGAGALVLRLFPAIEEQRVDLLETAALAGGNGCGGRPMLAGLLALLGCCGRCQSTTRRWRSAPIAIGGT